jgi:hypothetical protein
MALTAAWLGCGGSDDEPPLKVDTIPPAQINDLSIASAGTDSITLRWTATGDDGVDGVASSYVLKRSSSPINTTNFSAATTVAGLPDPASTAAIELFTVTGIDTNQTHYFCIRARDEAGNSSPISNNAQWVGSGPQMFEVSITSYLDNTLFEELEFDTLSNALGEHFFAGNNAGGATGGPDARRGLIAFDIAATLPAGATVDSVALELNMTKLRPGDAARNISLHVVTASWGEGTSIADLGPGEGGGGIATPGDATWLDRFRGTSLWTTEGGDFNAGPSATTNVGNLGRYTWTSSQMASDVQAWLDTPASNFGWILIGNEADSGSVRQFDTHENATPANRPRLLIFYTAP